MPYQPRGEWRGDHATGEQAQHDRPVANADVPDQGGGDGYRHHEFGRIDRADRAEHAAAAGDQGAGGQRAPATATDRVEQAGEETPNAPVPSPVARPDEA